MTDRLTGVTKDLKRRVYEPREGLVEAFAKRCNVDKLVYYEIFDDPYTAISREKQNKAGPRAAKERLTTKLTENGPTFTKPSQAAPPAQIATPPLAARNDIPLVVWTVPYRGYPRNFEVGLVLKGRK